MSYVNILLQFREKGKTNMEQNAILWTETKLEFLVQGSWVRQIFARMG